MVEQHGIDGFKLNPYANPFGFKLQPPHPNLQHERSPSSKRASSKPQGYKNKSKPQMVIQKENNHDVKSAIINVGAGSDVMEAVAQVAHHRNLNIMVVHAAGTISHMTLSNPLGQSPATFTAYGPFVILGLSGSYVKPTALDIGFPSSSLPSSIPNPPSSAIHSTFSIALSNFQGMVFGGIVAGKVMAGGNGVTVTAVAFKNPEYQIFDGFTEGNVVEDDFDNPLEGECGGDHWGASGSKGVDFASGFGMSGSNRY